MTTKAKAKCEDCGRRRDVSWAGPQRGNVCAECRASYAEETEEQREDRGAKKNPGRYGKGVSKFVIAREVLRTWAEFQDEAALDRAAKHGVSRAAYDQLRADYGDRAEEIAEEIERQIRNPPQRRRA